MDNERIREICTALPHVAETVNWGHHLVYWVGDRDIGGKMFAMTDLDGSGTGVLWFHCGAERFHELLENEGIIASPYLAKASWVTVERWDALRPREIEEELRRAHALIFERLPKRTKTILAMPEKERGKLIRERKKLLKERAKEKASKA
jgi:predicted DNA-binding protein (MmcQ/YjbR family)